MFGNHGDNGDNSWLKARFVLAGDCARQMQASESRDEQSPEPHHADQAVARLQNAHVARTLKQKQMN